MTSENQDHRFAVAVTKLARLQVQRPQIALLAVVAINESVPAIVRQSTRSRADRPNDGLANLGKKENNRQAGANPRSHELGRPFRSSHDEAQ